MNTKHDNHQGASLSNTSLWEWPGRSTVPIGEAMVPHDDHLQCLCITVKTYDKFCKSVSVFDDFESIAAHLCLPLSSLLKPKFSFIFSVSILHLSSSLPSSHNMIVWSLFKLAPIIAAAHSLQLNCWPKSYLHIWCHFQCSPLCTGTWSFQWCWYNLHFHCSCYPSHTHQYLNDSTLHINLQ